MRSRAAVFMGLACIFGTAFSCAAFEAATTVEPEEGGTSGNDGGDSSLLDSSTKADAALPDAPSASSPCPDGGTLLFRSRFDEGGQPSLAGWGTPLTTAGSTMGALKVDGGAVARGQVPAAAASPSYAVIARDGILPDFAVRISFSSMMLPTLYIIHQIYFSSGPTELTLSLQESGWTLGVGGRSEVIGANVDGALHTVTYRVAPAATGRQVTGTFDGYPPYKFEVAAADADAGKRLIQLGPFWSAPDGTAPPAVVDYSDVTVWNCAP